MNSGINSAQMAEANLEAGLLVIPAPTPSTLPLILMAKTQEDIAEGENCDAQSSMDVEDVNSFTGK